MTPFSSFTVFFFACALFSAHFARCGNICSTKVGDYDPNCSPVSYCMRSVCSLNQTEFENLLNISTPDDPTPNTDFMCKWVPGFRRVTKNPHQTIDIKNYHCFLDDVHGWKTDYRAFLRKTLGTPNTLQIYFSASIFNDATNNYTRFFYDKTYTDDYHETIPKTFTSSAFPFNYSVVNGANDVTSVSMYFNHINVPFNDLLESESENFSYPEGTYTFLLNGTTVVTTGSGGPPWGSCSPEGTSSCPYQTLSGPWP